MKTFTHNFSKYNAEAHCRDCSYFDSMSNVASATPLTSRVRRHVLKTGHKVEVFKTKAQLVGPLKNNS